MSGMTMKKMRCFAHVGGFCGRMGRACALLIAAFVISGAAQAQDYRYEIGPAVGISGYLGDVNNSNLLKHSGVAGGVLFRYNMNSRWAVKANLLYASISGNSNDISTQFPGGEHYEFKSNLYDLGAQMEFNFFSYGIGPRYKRYRRFTPYMTVGLGGVLASTGGKTNGSFVIPLGAGVKLKLKERLDLGFEFTMRKEFSDKIDGLSDLNGVKHSFAKNTDWYSVAMFSLTYEFGKRCTKCHYVE